jgi:hypothetical protein
LPSILTRKERRANRNKRVNDVALHPAFASTAGDNSAFLKSHFAACRRDLVATIVPNEAGDYRYLLRGFLPELHNWNDRDASNHRQSAEVGRLDDAAALTLPAV